MLKSFFAQDNATAKLASWLILFAAILSNAAQVLKLPDSADLWLVGLAAANTAAASFFNANKVVTRSGLLVLGYTILNVFITQDLLPQAKEILSFAAVSLKLIAEFSTQSKPQA